VKKFNPFLAMVDMIGEGRVYLIVGFTFFPSLPFRFLMANKSWVADDPQKTISVFAADGAAETPFRIIGEDADLEVELPSTSERVCS